MTALLCLSDGSVLEHIVGDPPRARVIRVKWTDDEGDRIDQFRRRWTDDDGVTLYWME